MNKLLALIPVTIAIFALMLSPAVMSVSAEKGGNGNAQGNPQGCDNDKGKDNVQNPNCGDPVPLGNINCTYTDDGNITPDELAAAILGGTSASNVTIASNWIGAAETSVGEETDGVIDHNPELAELNSILLTDTTNNPSGNTCF